MKLHSGAQYAQIVTFGKNHARLRSAGTVIEAAQDVGGRIHACLKRIFIAFHVDDGATGNAGVHACTGHSRGNDVDQARIKRGRDDIITPKLELFTVGHRDLVWDIFAGQISERTCAGDLHFVIDCAGMNIKRTTEQIREAQHVVYLVRIIGPTRRYNYVFAHCVHFLWCDLGVGVCHRENDRVWRHADHHVLGHSALG